jgi:hypothetical protein
MPGDTPYIEYGQQDDYRVLFFSEHSAALIAPITLQSGYGVLKLVTVLAKNLSALTTGNKDKLVPYNPTTFTGTEEHPGRAYLVANTGTTDSFVYVTKDDAYKFAVGDDIIINDNTTAKENLGAITAIDHTTYVHMSKITFTTAIGGTAFTTARFAYVAVEAGTASNNYSDAVGILTKSVDTGTGERAKGAVASVVLSGCLLYEGMLTNLDSAAKTALSASSFGEFLMIK